MPFQSTLQTIGRLLALSSLAIALTLATSSVVKADSNPDPETFAALVEKSRLVALVTVARLDPGGTVLRVERVLKGEADPELRFPTDPTDVPLFEGERAILAFQANNLDFRAPTVAWEVAADGRIDPHGFQQYPGLPTTLDTFLVAFGAEPATTAAGSPPQAGEPPVGEPPAPVAGAILILAAVTLVLVGAILVRRRRDV